MEQRFKLCRAVLSGLRSLKDGVKTSVFYFTSKDEFHKEVTELYPDPISSKSAEDLPSRARGVLENDVEKCTGCRDCVQVCPAECFHIETELGPEKGKVWISSFDIDHGKCLFCGLCVEVCNPGSLKHKKNFEAAVFHTEELKASFGKGSVTTEQRTRWQELRELVEREEL